MRATTLHPPRSWRRPAYGLAAAAAFGAAVAVTLTQGPSGWWLAFAMAPDIALLGGCGRDLAPGRLHPRAVPAYNALHRLAGPAALALVVALLGLGAGWTVAALAWAGHIAMDRAAGYDLRTPGGFRR